MKYSTEKLSEDAITLYITNFEYEMESVLEGPFIISWIPENTGPQYTFEIKDHETFGNVTISSL